MADHIRASAFYFVVLWLYFSAGRVTGLAKKRTPKQSAKPLVRT
jgi:hypothetical protein